MDTKKCCKCKQVRPISEFYEVKSYKDGHSYKCKLCSKEDDLRYSRSKRGVVASIYHSQNYTSKHRNHPLPEYTMLELKNWLFNHHKFDVLYDEWVKSGYDKYMKPSVDRLDDYKPYTFTNIQLGTFMDNLNKVSNDIKNGLNNKMNRAILQFDKDGNFIKEYYSIAQIERETGLFSGNICRVCRGRKKTCGGFIWKYKL